MTNHNLENYSSARTTSSTGVSFCLFARTRVDTFHTFNEQFCHIFFGFQRDEHLLKNTTLFRIAFLDVKLIV